MNVLTVITALIVLGIVWGGLVVFLFKAYTSERKKNTSGNI